MKKILKVFLIIIFLTYLGLYFSYKNGYIEQKNHEKSVLTDEMILEYEKDLQEGVDVTKKSYTVIEKSYANNYTKLNLKLSSYVENGLDWVIKSFFQKISNYVEN